MEFLSLQKPRSAKGDDQLNALRMIAYCRADWNGDAAPLQVSHRADILQFSRCAAEVPRFWRGAKRSPKLGRAAHATP